MWKSLKLTGRGPALPFSDSLLAESIGTLQQEMERLKTATDYVSQSQHAAQVALAAAGQLQQVGQQQLAATGTLHTSLSKTPKTLEDARLSERLSMIETSLGAMQHALGAMQQSIGAMDRRGQEAEARFQAKHDESGRRLATLLYWVMGLIVVLGLTLFLMR